MEDAAIGKLKDRMVAEPGYRHVLYRILDLCRTARPSAGLEAAIAAFPEMAATPHPARILLSWLVEAGGLASAPADAGEAAWRTTAAGLAMLEIESPDHRLAALLAGEPAYGEVYRQVLRSCLTPRTRAEIEATLAGHPLLENPKLYAGYFVERLEHAGGLAWDRKWQATPAGAAIVG